MSGSRKPLFLFPGVGSQQSGMARLYFDRSPVVREAFEEASDVLGQDMAALCFRADRRSDLDDLRQSQVALVCVCVALHRVLAQELGLERGSYLGYSLGEYSALCSAGALSFADALALVWERGTVLKEVAAEADGSMMWVVNLPAARVDELCSELRAEGQRVWVSAYDSPEKASVSGTQDALRSIGERVVAAGGIPISIKMSGPFHSPLMQRAADRIRDVLAKKEIAMPAHPVISNLTARPYESVEEIRDNLAVTLVSPLRWSESLAHALAGGADTSIEVGPKDVLTYILKKNSSRIESFTLDETDAVERIRAAFVVDILAFVAACLRTIVTTRNRHGDEAEYERETVGSYRALSRLEEEIRQGLATESEAALLERASDLTARALRGKAIADAEIATRLSQLRRTSSADPRSKLLRAGESSPPDGRREQTSSVA